MQSEKTKIKSVTKKTLSSQSANLLFKWGYFVRGAIYVLIGVLSLRVALQNTGSFVNPKSALLEVDKTLLINKLLLVIIIIGLISYSLWKVIKIFTQQKEKDGKDHFKRLGDIFSAVSYFVLAIASMSLLGIGHIIFGSSNQFALFTKLFLLPHGNIIIGLIGIIWILIAASQFYLSYTNEFEEEINLKQLDEKKEKAFLIMGKIGLFSRGIIFGLIGYIFILAAIKVDPSKIKGIEGALLELEKIGGTWLLTLVSVGLICFGIYSVFVGSWFRNSLRKN